MAAFLLSVHVLAAIVFIGPVTVAVSLFPRYARLALADPRGPAVPVVHALHRVSRVYAVLALAVPVFGLATAVRMDVLTEAWVVVSVALTLAAAAVLALVVLPRQRAVGQRIERDDGTGSVGGLAMAAGAFNLLWAVVVVLMIVRPGSTTGV
jgi:hypothetical protein